MLGPVISTFRDYLFPFSQKPYELEAGTVPITQRQDMWAGRASVFLRDTCQE